jgi:hypothetical protein
MVKITIDIPDFIYRDVREKLYRHISGLCRLLSDDEIKVNFQDDTNCFGRKK